MFVKGVDGIEVMMVVNNLKGKVGAYLNIVQV